MTEPYRVIHDEVFLSWEDVNAIAAELDAAGFVIVSRDRLDALEAVADAVRDWVAFGAGDGTEAAEADGQRLLEAIVAGYVRLTALQETPR